MFALYHLPFHLPVLYNKRRGLSTYFHSLNTDTYQYLHILTRIIKTCAYSIGTGLFSDHVLQHGLPLFPNLEEMAVSRVKRVY